MSAKPKTEGKAVVPMATAVDTKRLSAEPIERIIDITTDQPVGWVYKWNTGETTVMWMTRTTEKIRYEIVQAA